MQSIDEIFKQWKDGLITDAECMLAFAQRRAEYCDNNEAQAFADAFPQVAESLYRKEQQQPEPEWTKRIPKA